MSPPKQPGQVPKAPPTADQLAIARSEGRNELLALILGDETEEGLGIAILGAKEAERDLMSAIGQVYCDVDDSRANDMRDRLWRTQTCREICERLLDQVRR